MAEEGFPNKNRASNALDIYRDAMRQYIAPLLERKHGADWIRSQVLNDELRERNPSSYGRRLQSLKAGTPAHNLVDLAEFPFLIRDNEGVFSDLRTPDTHRMHQIRDLRNEIQHPDREGDCTPEEAASIAGLCVLVLERCGLSDAVEHIRHLSSSTPAGGPAVPESELRQQRERREWDKARLAGKSPEDLTPWEQQRLAEIEWEEEWERRELVRSEREALAGFGDDIDGLRLWFNADETRHDRHLSEHATLLQQEEKRREQQERERAEQARREKERRERERREQQERERAEQARREKERREREQREQQERRKRAERERRERERREREQTEIAAFGDDIDGLRRWFDVDTSRKHHHLPQYAALLQQEQERELPERERAEIAVFGDDIDGLRRWFDAETGRKHRHPPQYVALLRREQRRRELPERELPERERAETAALGGHWPDLRRWFQRR